MNEFYCFEVFSFCDVDGIVYVVFGFKVDWIFVIYFLLVICNKLNINVIVSNLCGWGVFFVRSFVFKFLYYF